MENSNGKKETDNTSEKFIKRSQPTIPDKPNVAHSKIVIPNNNTCDPGPSTEKSSNVGQGPSVENL